MVSNTATVSRVINDLGENARVELPIDQLVPGDLVKLAAGDMIPADLRIIGRAICSWPRPRSPGVPAGRKVARSRDPQQMNPLECDTLCFMGTTVVSGTAQAIVTATGGNTGLASLPDV